MKLFKLFLFCINIFFVSMSFGMQDQDKSIDLADQFGAKKKYRISVERGIDAMSIDGCCIARIPSKESHFVKIFDFDREKITLRCICQHDDRIVCIYFSQDNNFLMFGGEDGVVGYFNIEDCGEKNVEIAANSLYAHNERVECICINKSGKYIVSGSLDGEFKIFDMEKKKEVFSYTIDKKIASSCCSSNFERVFNFLFIDEDKKHVTFGLTNGMIKRFNIEDGNEISSVSKDLPRVLKEALDKAKHYFTCSQANSVLNKIIEAYGVERDKVIQEKRDWVSCLFLSARRYLVVGTHRGHVGVFDIVKKKVVGSHQHEQKYHVDMISLLDDGQTLFSIDYDGNVIERKTSQNFCKYYKEYKHKERWGKYDLQDEKERIGFIIKKSEPENFSKTEEAENDQEIFNFTIKLGGQKLLKSCKSFL